MYSRNKRKSKLQWFVIMAIYKKIITHELKGKIAFIAIGCICLTFLSINFIVGLLAVAATWLISIMFILQMFKVDKKRRDEFQRYLIRTGMFTWGWLLNVQLVDDALKKPRKLETKKKLIWACSSSAGLYILSAIGMVVFGSFYLDDFVGMAFLTVLAPLSFFWRFFLSY
jgi:hypothetical protein